MMEPKKIDFTGNVFYLNSLIQGKSDPWNLENRIISAKQGKKLVPN